MSVNSEEIAIQDDTFDSLQVLPKLDAKSKLRVSHALHSGQSDEAEDNSVAQQINIDQALLEWFLLETKCGNYVSKNVFRQKALEIIDSVGAESIGIDDWLQEFRTKHKIAEFSADIDCKPEMQDKWKRLLSHCNSSNVYFGGMFALSHNLDIESYFNGQTSESEDYVSIMFAVNSSGTIKRQLAVSGKDLFDKNITIPVKYYHCHTATPNINYFIFKDYLETWNRDLHKVGKQILLIVNLPDNILHELKSENIKLISTENFVYINHVLEKLTECFKFNYRQLQIISNGIRNENLSDYIHMFAMAWHSVPSRYIEFLCSPQANGCLYFDVNDENYGDHSLSHWYKMKKISLDFNQCLDHLDEYIYCDSKLQCVNWSLEDVPSSSTISTNPLITKSLESSSSFQAYQAMRRLVSYIHEQNCSSVLKYAKYLENHTEYRVLAQMHEMSTEKTD